MSFPVVWRYHRLRGRPYFRVYFRNGQRTKRMLYDNAETLFETLRGDTVRISFEPPGHNPVLVEAPPASILNDRTFELERIARDTESFVSEALPSLVARPDLQRRASALLSRVWDLNKLKLPLTEE